MTADPDETPPPEHPDAGIGGDGETRRFTRRQALTLAGTGAGSLVGAGLAARWLFDDASSTSATRSPAARRSRTTTSAPATTTTAPPTTAEAAPLTRAHWSDPATWDGQVPGPGDVAVIDRAVILDVDATVAGVRVEGAGELVFDEAQSRTLTSTGNVVVAGAFRARPRSAEVVHRVVFDGVDETRFVGGHTPEPLDTDVGVWVVGDGVLDLQGAAKRAWTNLTGSAAAGDAHITVADAAGWRVGDEVVVTPTGPTTPGEEDQTYAERHDRRTVTALQGTTVTLDRPLEHAHPAITVRPGVSHNAEVLNLTRNVLVAGTPKGRAHVMFLHGAEPQHLSYVGLRHLGPQVAIPARGEMRDVGVLGRYSLHFHMCHDGSRRSLVEGLVAYDGGNSAFVPHLSHGITFRDCIAHDQVESAFWWDQAPDEDEESDSVPTHDVVLERCVAHLLRFSENSRYGLAGFMLGAGRGNVARGCVAAGVLGGDEATAGYTWPDGSRDQEHPWTMEGCLSHNNYASAIYYWQNNVPRTIVDRFTSYHDRRGIEAGSYTNLVSYRDCTIYACRTGGLTIKAVAGGPRTSPDETITYENVYVDQAGLTEFAVYVAPPIVEAAQATRVSGCRFLGGTTAQLGFPEPGEFPHVYEITDCRFDGNAFWLAEGMPDRVAIRVRDATNGTIMLRGVDQPGSPRAEWNASITPA
ncbi:MAG: G8 domain-containing protein [Acidimicrobiales bacterium]